MSSIWQTLSAVDCSKHIEKKNGFSYLSWAWAWSILKQHYPTAQYTKHLFNVGGNQLPYMLDADGYAYVTVTVKIMPDSNSEAVVPIESATEVMPVLNHANRPIQKPNSFEVNASLQRCMVKAIAALGLGCYIYAGEDMPMESPTAMVQSPNIKTDMAAPKKIKSPLTLEQEVAMAPSIDSLKSLYNRVQINLTPEQRQLFSNRKKELEANG